MRTYETSDLVHPIVHAEQKRTLLAVGEPLDQRTIEGESKDSKTKFHER